MKKIILMAALLGGSTFSFAAAVFSPTEGVVCDKKANFCVDNQGISMRFTAQYLGKQAQRTLQKSLGDGTGIDLGEYTFSNGVHCVSEDKQCYSDRFYPRTGDKYESTWTAKIFDKAR
ncbi:hypothetical protein GRAQ_01731 [Rahnella aquatilis CIP 78.65 = ATCC 33071]|jgi:Fels-1 Prophage Protein-like.|uniref:Fels-1 Prophage Protein n=1 Tax=Rahnella aquatilis (strain ATCC 33071 / DSM 4594 / JCM 1683 / NBRC 105701 / NCIMB 13365 / CIP 78.65) TaxID=745277 RepID=H2IRM9_RAHAC|nr:YcgJ family protein [Rahnella aquatilis]AEX52530.1 Fels-1 Prophage Protein [Rahnella aquatilis CIP 78.65 = ATCC 33071]KFD06647.1 hypothetical protein GRAQ_01731 [Rahnella aquatilis CIP 78.65 = ATCC 33071]